MSIHHLDVVLPELTRLWQEQPRGAIFFSKVRTLKRFYRRYCKIKALSFWEEELTARRLLEGITAKLQDALYNSVIQQEHGTHWERLQAIETKVTKGHKVCSRIRWKHKGDLVSTEFFWSIQEKSTSTIITCLLDDQGNEVQDR